MEDSPDITPIRDAAMLIQDMKLIPGIMSSKHEQRRLITELQRLMELNFFISQ